jgi:hypothetical protein
LYLGKDPMLVSWCGPTTTISFALASAVALLYPCSSLSLILLYSLLPLSLSHFFLIILKVTLSAYLIANGVGTGPSVGTPVTLGSVNGLSIAKSGSSYTLSYNTGAGFTSLVDVELDASVSAVGPCILLRIFAAENFRIFVILNFFYFLFFDSNRRC